MTDLKAGYVLKPGQLECPVVWRSSFPVTFTAVASDRFLAMLLQVFGPGRSKRLQTWDRAPEDPDGPHWIGVRNGTPLHTDPRYPRYTHQLIVLNQGWTLSGITRQVSKTPFKVGESFCCDTHSPHILLREPGPEKGFFYLAASIDAREVLPPAKVEARLAQFVENWLRT